MGVCLAVNLRAVNKYNFASMLMDVVSQRYHGHAVALASQEEEREHDDGHDSPPKRRKIEVRHAVTDNVDSAEGGGREGGRGKGGW